ncbi:MAG: D-alanyl-D-alanine carboxypeptidase/D-alanyl-D-alanine-endopeptidase [Myxococcales bacterium]
MPRISVVPALLLAVSTRALPLAMTLGLFPASQARAAPPVVMAKEPARAPTPGAGSAAAGGATVQPAPPSPSPTSGAAEETAPPLTGSTKLPGLSSRPGAPLELPRPPADPGQRKVWLKTALDDALNAPALSKAKIAVLVSESEGGKTLYARGEKSAMNAASNVKIVTSAAALALLGPEYRWRTTVAAAAAKGTAVAPGGEIGGDLFLKGYGDPTLGTQGLAAMVSELAAMGVKRIKGSIVADESFFDGSHVGPSYEQKTDSTVSRAPSAALSLNGNVVEIVVIPGGKAGAPARVIVDPPSGAFTVAGRIVTASSGPAVATIDTKDDPGGKTQIVVSGRVRLGSEPRSYKRRITNPPLFAAYTLKALLERRGIAVGQAPKTGTTPAQGMRILATIDSPPMGVVVHDLNKRSNNFVAEQVLRTMGAEIVGRPGTWDKGLEAVARYLATLGIRKGTYQMSNGSGLYDSNRFTPEQLVTVLRGAMRDFRISAEFMASLAIAGTDGTIGHRMGNTPAERFVRAKTGTLANASCLSGFAGSPGHAPLVFSILMNDVVSATDARRAQDRVAELLVAYIEADAPTKP